MGNAPGLFFATRPGDFGVLYNVHGRVGFQSLKEFVRTRDVVFLSWPSDQPDWIAQRIAGGMDFGVQTAAGAAQTLGIRPPFI